MLELESILKQQIDNESILSKISKKTKLAKSKKREVSTAKVSLKTTIKDKNESKNALTYKDKAKLYYLGLKNNWVEEENKKVEYRTQQDEQKNRTAHSPIPISLNNKGLQIDEGKINLKINK